MSALLPSQTSISIVKKSGIDTYIKTGGQFITKTDLLNIEGNDIIHRYHATNKYGFSACYGIKNLFPKGRILGKYDENGTVGIEYLCDSAKAYTFEKLSYIITDRDTDKDITECASERIASCDLTFDRQKKAHISVYKSYFATMDVKIEGDDEIDAYLRFASYHTAISASMKDSIHGISAKGLTGERYNQFVWWDCEIHQMPFFLLTAPQTAKNALMYRYRMLEQAKKNANKLMVAAMALTAVISLITCVFVRPIVGFYNLSPEGTEIAVKMMLIHGVFGPLLWPWSFTFPNALRAANDAKYTMRVSIGTMWFFRLGLAYFFGAYLGLGAVGNYIAMVFDWAARAAFFVPRFYRGKWQKLKGI